jgi:hypothetical protein
MLQERFTVPWSWALGLVLGISIQLLYGGLRKRIKVNKL